MTIDEAIKKEKNEAKQCREEIIQAEYLEPQEKYFNSQIARLAEEHEQLAEWLEELNSYKLGECMNDCEHYDNCSNYIYSKGYTKAIDAFVKECEAEYDNDGCPGVSDCLDYKLSLREIFEIAEQLKEGGVDE